MDESNSTKRGGLASTSVDEVAVAPASETAVIATVSEAPEVSDALLGARPQASDAEQQDLEVAIVEALKTVYDPEIPVNIYELGLIYDLDVQPDRNVHLKMTLTAPGCPVAGSLPGEIQAKVASVPGVSAADVELVWDPPWNPSMMSEAARLQLGMF